MSDYTEQGTLLHTYLQAQTVEWKMSEEKSDVANAQKHQPERVTRYIFIALIAILFLLSMSGFFFVLRNKGISSQLSTNVETTTPSPTPTLVYLETPPALSEFYDTFKNNALGWSVSSTAGYFRIMNPGELTLMDTNRGTTVVESLPTNAVFDNCTVSVDFTMLKVGWDDSIGIYVRGDTSLEHDYRIDLNGNGTFDVAKEYLDSRNNPQTVMLVGPENDSSLNPQGDLNTITLTLNGSQLQIFMNNVMIGLVNDSDYTAGQVALFAHLGEHSPEIAVSFSRVEIDKFLGTLSGYADIYRHISYSH